MSEAAPLPEKMLWLGRPSFWNWWLELLIGDLLIALAALLWWAGHERFSPWALAAAGFLYAGVAIIRLGRSYRITDQRVAARRGMLAKSTSEVEIKDIRNITLEQSVFQRLVGVGDIGISSAGGEEVEVRFEGVSDAEAVKERIRAARRSGDAAGGE